MTVNFTDAIIIFENDLFTVGVDKTLERQEKSDGRNKGNSFFHNPVTPLLDVSCYGFRQELFAEFYFITFLHLHNIS